MHFYAFVYLLFIFCGHLMFINKDIVGRMHYQPSTHSCTLSLMGPFKFRINRPLLSSG